MRFILSLLATAALAGCSTTAVPLSRATPAPAERVISQQFSKPADGAQEITLVRDSGVYGSGYYTVLWVDGVQTAKLDPSESLKVYLPKGAHFLTASRNVWGAGAGPTFPLTVPSATTAFRISDGQVILPTE